MDARVRDRLALGIAGIALLAALATLMFGRFDPGVRLAASNGRIMVTAINEHSIARSTGLQAGMIVTQINNVTLIRFPEYVYPALPPSPDPDGNEVAPQPIGVEPTEPTDVPLPADQLDALVNGPTTNLVAIQPWDLAHGTLATGWGTFGIYDDGRSGLRDSMPSVFLGAAILFIAGWWLASGRAGAGLQPLAVPLAVATAVPFILRPLDATWSPPVIALGGILLPLAMLPLAAGLHDRIADVNERRLVAQAVGACVLGALLVGIGLALTEPWSGSGVARWALVGAIPLIPGLAAAGPIQPGGLLGAATSSGRLLESTEFAVAGATPLVALSTDSGEFLFPFALWIGLILVAGRFTVRPLARLATRAQLQRDLVVAATEAERARVAADIHDDALQELTLLVQRLDTAGDTEGADIARTVSDRLRAICGDLRLPILDDLGVGPALDWLVLRIERLAGGEVRLERSDGTRPPADVELAFFRVAQEALANAVKHGRPPIVVRYASTSSGVSLSIDDAGPGIAPDAGEAAERSGHFGLLNMQQRAEAIGAILDVRRWPTGGTHVALEWRAP
ncbi:MAG: sensor histidine kinase [Chloroflexota bacterium]